MSSGFVPAPNGATLVSRQRSNLSPRTGRQAPNYVEPIRRRVPLRMVATSDKGTETASSLTPKAAELLGYLRAHKSIFSPGVGFKATHLALYRKNDTGKSLVPADELTTNESALPGVEVARIMLEKKDDILEKAKADVIAAAASIAEDTTVSAILWHDLAYFFRVASYGAAVSSVNFLHEDNMNMVKALYEEIQMPRSALETGINSMKSAVLKDVDDEKLRQVAGQCFDVISNFLAA